MVGQSKRNGSQSGCCRITIKRRKCKDCGKVVTKTQVIKTRGEDIVKYVDREVVKYDTKFAPGEECEIPKEFIKAINDAAEGPK
jgi:hypothetical protein